MCCQSDSRRGRGVWESLGGLSIIAGERRAAASGDYSAGTGRHHGAACQSKLPLHLRQPEAICAADVRLGQSGGRANTAAACDVRSLSIFIHHNNKLV